MLMVPILLPVCQHAAAAVMVKSEPGPSIWMSSCYKTYLGHADKDTASSSSNQLQPDPGRREKTPLAHDMEKGPVFFMWSYLRSPWVKIVGLTNTARDCLAGTLWHSSNSRHFPPRKPQTWEPNSIFNNYKPGVDWQD